MSGPVFTVDAGDNGTIALIRPSEGLTTLVELPPIDPRSGGAAANATLIELLATVHDLVDGRPATGWLAGAVVPEVARVRAAARHVGLSATVVVSDDKVPVLSGVLSGIGVVAVCGLGAGFLGGDGLGRVSTAGGCDYLGGDEGSAVDIGRYGLRAAVRATDGRGPTTGLVDAFGDVAALARQLAAEPFPRRGLAELAPIVCDRWLSGDDVAGEVIQQAVTELATGVLAVLDALDLAPGFPVAATGAMFTGCLPFYHEFADHVTEALGAGSVELVTDAPLTTVAALDRFQRTGGLPVPAEHATVLSVDEIAAVAPSALAG